MSHWRTPHYAIETEFGTLHAVSEEDALAATECFAGDPPIKFTLKRERGPLCGWIYIPGMVLIVSMVIVGLAFLFGG